MTFWEKAQNVDRRIIYGLMIIALAFPMIRPMGLAISINKETKMAYDAIDKLAPGSIVWLSMDFDAAGMPDVMPAVLSMMRQGFAKNLRFVAGGMWVMAGNLAETAWIRIAPEFPAKKYGVDFVNVGYKPGGVVLLEKIITDAEQAFLGTDARGTKFSQLPLMAEFKSFKNAALIVTFVVGTPGAKEYIKHVTDVLRLPLVVSCQMVNVPEIMPNVQAGQIVGLISGMRGAAEYEILVGKPGQAVAGMDSQSSAHVLIMLLIIAGNLGYILTRKKPSAGQAG